MSGASELDHVGVVGRDVRALAGEFARLGFALTPLARHEGGRTGNRNIMLRQGYIELLSVVDGGHSATLDRFLARYAGIHILAFAIDDPAAAVARLQRAGFVDAAISRTERAIDDANPGGGRARFAMVTTPDIPEGRVHLIHHESRDALWQQRFLQHPNHAVALEEVLIVSADPATTAFRLSLRAGRPLRPDPAGGYRLTLPRGAVRMLSPDAFAAMAPDVSPPSLPWIAGAALLTDDATAALRRWLEQQRLPWVEQRGAVSVKVGGAVVRFT